MKIFSFKGRADLLLLIKSYWLPALVIFWIAGYFFFPSNKLHYQFFLLIFLMGSVWLILQHRLGNVWLSSSTVLKMGGLFVTFYFLSIFWSVDTTFSERLSEIKTVLYLLIFTSLITYCLRQYPGFLLLLLKLVLVVAGLSLILNLILFYVIEGNDLSGRFHGFGRLWSPLWMAAVYGALTVISVGILTHRALQLSPAQKFWLILLASLFFVALLATQSRMAIAAAISVSFIAAITSDVSPKFRLLSVVIILSMLGLTMWLSATMFDRMVERGQSYRLDIWQGALDLVSEKPFAGYGAGSDIHIDTVVKEIDGWHHYHSSYIATLVDLGMLGFMLSMLLIASTFRAAWRLRQNLVVRISICVFLYCLMISLTFGEGFISRMNVQWLLFWLPLIIIAHYETKQRSTSSLQ
jgi:O-antigen ligase